jgi:hypothetical protein
MIYRKSPRTPPRLLLRIVATAGVGALVAGAACSGREATQGLMVDPGGDDASCDAFGTCSPYQPSGTSASSSGPMSYAGGVTVSSSGGFYPEPPSDASFSDTMYESNDGQVSDASGATDASDAAVDATDAASDDGSDCHLICGSVVVPPDGGEAGAPCWNTCNHPPGLVPPPPGH